MQGGIDPELPASAYFDIAAAVKQRVPGMHVHAFSPMEVVNGTARTGQSIEDCLIKAHESGLGSLPRTAAEIRTTRSAGCSPRASCPPAPG